MPLANVCHWPILPPFSGKVLRDRRAVTSIEYAIIAIIITVAIFGGLSVIGSSVATVFNHVNVEL